MQTHVSVVTIGRDLAKSWLELFTWEHQRPISKPVVEKYAFLIENGRFLPDSELRFAQLPSGTRYLINGHHRLHALTKSTKSVQFVRVISFCATLKDVAELYGTLDVGKGRTYRDVFAAHDMRDTAAKLAAPALRVLHSYFIKDGAHHDKNAIVEVYQKDFRDAAQTAYDLLKGSSVEVRKILTRAPVFAVILVTLRHQPDTAREFWGSIAHENLETGPCAQRAFLIWARSPRNVNADNTARMLAAATAWNAYAEGRFPTRLSPGSHTLSELSISGTPYQRAN